MFQRDWDRILHRLAFRWLECKFQVLVNGTADHQRNRLTHPMEMASLGRTTARVSASTRSCPRQARWRMRWVIRRSAIAASAFIALMRDWGGFYDNDQSCRAIELVKARTCSNPSDQSAGRFSTLHSYDCRIHAIR